MLRWLISLFLGYALGVCNLYMAARVGFTIGVAFMTAFTWGILDQALRRLNGSWRRGSPADHACRLSLTSAMSYGSVTVIATALAAMLLEGAAPHPVALVLWTAGLGVLGTAMALPLRRAMLQAYAFPSGHAAADLVRRLQRDGQSDRFIGPMLLVWVGMFVRERFGLIPHRLSGRYGFAALEVSPMLLGLGALLGPATGLSMALGGLCFYGLVPAVWPHAEDRVLWFAVGMILAATLVSLVGARPTVPVDAGTPDPAPEASPWPLPALFGGSLLLAAGYLAGWGVEALWGLLLLPLTWFFAQISGSVTGQTDVVPTGALGKLSLLGLSFLPGLRECAMLHTGSLTGTAAATADFLTDLRCGQRLDCDPRRQFRYQLAGALLGPILLVPTFLALTADRLGGEAFPVPAARIWLGVAHLAEAAGLYGQAIALGCCLGALLQVLCMRTKADLVPRPTVFAMAAMLDMGTCTTLALGGLAGYLWRKRGTTALWSALICAEALAAVFLYG